MRVGSVTDYRAVNPAGGLDLEEIYNRRIKEAAAASEEEALQKVEEVQSANTQATFKMMDRHNEIVEKSQERLKEQAQKRAVERLAKKRAEEHSEVLAEIAVSNAERRDLLEASRMKDTMRLLA